MNPNRAQSGFAKSSTKFKKGCTPWNKGIPCDDEVKKVISSKLKGRKWKASSAEVEENRRKKISETMKSNPKAGGLREGSGRGLKEWYESKFAGRVYLRSTYESRYARWLDENNIKWVQPKEGFDYTFQGNTHKYYPDFYLIEENVYVEVKGYKTKRDIAKWQDFPYNLKIIYKKDIEAL